MQKEHGAKTKLRVAKHHPFAQNLLAQCASDVEYRRVNRGTRCEEICMDEIRVQRATHESGSSVHPR